MRNGCSNVLYILLVVDIVKLTLFSANNHSKSRGGINEELILKNIAKRIINSTH